MDIVEAKNLTKRFNKFLAVDNVSFSLGEGEILGLLGPNGAGKTTVIQMLLGILTPSSGGIFYFGKSLNEHRSEILERVNFSSTYTNLPWDLTVRENLSFISYLYRIEDRKRRIGKIMEIFELEDLKTMPFGELSAGQQTRVNLAKAMLNYPKVLLLDEPTASLDPDVADYIRKFLEQERKEFKVSLIFTSHNMSEVEELCDRVIFIDQGKIIADDKPQQLAKTIELCHIELLISQGLEQLTEYCRMERIECSRSGNFLTVDVRERDIPKFLSTLVSLGVVYDEISINKPSLEDYFLEKARKGTLK